MLSEQSKLSEQQGKSHPEPSSQILIKGVLNRLHYSNRCHQDDSDCPEILNGRHQPSRARSLPDTRGCVTEPRKGDWVTATMTKGAPRRAQKSPQQLSRKRKRNHVFSHRGDLPPHLRGSHSHGKETHPCHRWMGRAAHGIIQPSAETFLIFKDSTGTVVVQDVDACEHHLSRASVL
ncbi:hypothetical protein EK904_000076 [Melospiza melodia maxima]|nr:hypothetical protein EK904_000076 [Melospiza melodia maxima]